MGKGIKLYRYVSVLYTDEPMNGKTYYYKTDKFDLEEGDIVTVLRNDEIVDAEVISVETYKENEVPFPLDKVKDIIAKTDNSVTIEI
jgi:hypothetical protein